MVWSYVVSCNTPNQCGLCSGLGPWQYELGWLYIEINDYAGSDNRDMSEIQCDVCNSLFVSVLLAACWTLSLDKYLLTRCCKHQYMLFFKCIVSRYCQLLGYIVFVIHEWNEWIIGWMVLTAKTKVLREEPVSVPISPAKIPHGLAWEWMQASVARVQWLIDPWHSYQSLLNTMFLNGFIQYLTNKASLWHFHDRVAKGAQMLGDKIL
jgi:hypothetical protein